MESADVTGHPSHYRTNSLEADPPGSGPGASASYMREKTVIAEETGHHRQRECDGEGGGGNAFTSSEQREVLRLMTSPPLPTTA